MTIEEEEGEQVMASKSCVVYVDDNNCRSESPQTKDATNTSKEDSVRSKMEAMQKRIDELKEKVKYEGELLYNKEGGFDQDIVDRKYLDSLSDIKSKDSLSQDSNNYEDKILENEEHSDKSLYFSASSYSMCSVSSISSDSNYSSFTKFVNNFVKNQDHKERLNLLQLHTKKQISLKMMKTSLSQLESRCSEELKLVERSLKHLHKLAEELHFDPEKPEVDSSKLEALNFNSFGDSGPWRPMTKASFKCLPFGNGSKPKLELGKDVDSVKYNLNDISSKLT